MPSVEFPMPEREQPWVTVSARPEAEGIASDDSDIGLLVEFSTNSVSLLLFNQLKYELEEDLEKNVDVIHGPLSDEAMIQPNKVVSLNEHERAHGHSKVISEIGV